ncbi:coiled-coil domain containing 57 [Rhinolophus ferrumequinum]|uniref:Coiled-coil domain containing 57 n=1 Tax=Rhinolophus ferrumequinum TaxID=59479 RepID=A0A7J7QZG4_RHIFE|nr:coiled-coil domain containing 57 [Rhinolophus ferrumequinum]
MALEEARGRLRSLQEDFVYNLQVLEERDRELERYDAAFARARGLEEAWQAEVSQLKVEAARLRQALAREAEQREDLQRLHQRELREHRLALERAHSDKNSEIDQQREQYEKLKWKLERRLQELDGELALQRQELLQEFESEMQKRERSFRLQADSMSHATLTQELQVKLLNKELAALREAGAQAAESLQSTQTVNLELEERLQRGAQELRDLAAVKDARHEELDRLARERDAVLASVKSAHTEQLQALEARVVELQVQCEALELQLRRAEWRQMDALKEKDATLDKLREEAAALRSGWDAQVAQLSRDMTSKDLQVQSLQEEEAELKAQLAKCQQDTTRYQQQLSLAAEREQSLEREKVQLGLDWQHRCASIERDHYRKSEELIQGLTVAREQAAAKLQEAERKLCDQEVLLKAVTLERDQAVQVLRTRGLLPEDEGKAQMLLRRQEEEISQSFPSSEIRRLQEQNTSLRDAVAQMRTEMEALSGHALPSARRGGVTAGTQQPDTQAAAAAPTPDYVPALEAEIQNLKHKFKTLEEQLEEPSRVSSSNADIQPRVSTSAGATGGTVPAAGASAGFALRRLGDRAQLLNFLVARLRQKVLQEPLDKGTVRCELAHEVDQVCLEVLELRKRTAELEKHLGTAPEAGGGPPSQQQPRAPDTVALGREGPADVGPAGTEGLAVQRLQRKLKEAARKILHLRLEKEQLVELGNRLRAELGQPVGTPRHPLPGRKTLTPGDKTQAPSDCGLPVGQLQPHCTAQDTKNTKEDGFCDSSAKIRSHVAQTGRRIDAWRGCAAGKVEPKPHEVSTVTCRSTRQKENQSPKPHQAQEFHQDNGHHTQRSSSLASSSLQDTWKLLDLGSSPSGLTSQDDSTPELTAPPAADNLPHPDSPVAIKGMKMKGQAKPERPSKAHPAKPKGYQRPPKVRNYNFKD